MGYFANGSEGDDFEEQFCRRCVHEREGEFCPVIVLHQLWQYDQLDAETDRHYGREPQDPVSEAKRFALEALIPTEGAYNGQCRMFHPRPEGGDR